MKRALVLSGGGSRGAYEIGAWQALTELGIRFQAVYGTSIGAINACLVAQGDLDIALKLWQNISIKQIVATDEEDISVERMVSNKRDVIPFLMENSKYLQMDISPLENLVNTHIDEGRIRAGGMDLGVMTVRVPQLMPVPMRLKDMQPGTVGQWALASAACFPVFPTRRIAGEKYVDGGYSDNLPIDMAIEDGADEIIAVDIHPQPTHPEYAKMPFLKMIHPLHNLGGFLDFNQKLLKRSTMMGYYDTMKAYDAYDGIRYTFLPKSDLKYAGASRRFMQLVARFDVEAVNRHALKFSGEQNAPLISQLGEETPLKELSWKEVYLRGLEKCAQSMGFREDAIYDPDELTGRMLTFASQGEPLKKMTEKGILTAAAKGRRELISYIYRAHRDLGEFPADCIELLAEYPDETVAALYLVCAKDA